VRHCNRYPDDKYDRLWTSDAPNLRLNRFANYSAALVNVSTPQNYGPPLKVMQSAWTAPLASSIEILWPVPTGIVKTVIAIVYFAEIASVPRNSSGLLQASIDGSLFQAAPIQVTPAVFSTFNFTLSFAETAFNIKIDSAPGSTLGPILNAVEIFYVQFINSSNTSWQPDCKSSHF
jgi:hypothetical protein